MIVADVNLIAYLLIPGPFTTAAESVFRKDPEWAAPYLWRSELRNILATYIRTRTMPLPEALRKMAEADAVINGHDIAVPSDKVLAEAAGRDLAAYDAEYIVAARQLGVPLVTCDTRLRNAVPDVALRPEEFR